MNEVETEVRSKQGWHSQKPEDVIAAFGSNLRQGLSEEEAESRRKKFGLNKIAEGKKRSLVLLFLTQFKSSVVYLLLAAAALSFYFQEWADAIAILSVLLINACIGFYMEMQAQRSMDALQKLTAVPARAVRNSKLMQTDSVNLVPGDIIFLEAGDMITADARIIKCAQMQVNEASLTGESAPVEKSERAVDEDATLHERTGMVYKGTFVTKGNAYAVVTETGMQTQLGKVAQLVELSEQAATPLEAKLTQFSKKLIYVTLGLVLLIFITGLLHGHELLKMVQTCIALSVAAIPEGLPIVATLALANGMIRMAKKKVIIRKLSAVETLGGTDVICTDKTGTLTENRITVATVVTPCSEWNGNGEVPADDSMKRMIEIAALCNTSEIRDEHDEGTGDPVETGLLKFVLKAGKNIGEYRNDFIMKDQEPFSSETKMMATVHEIDGIKIVFCKGAAEEVIDKCTSILNGEKKPFTEKEKNRWLQKAYEISSSGMKVIAGAFNNSYRQGSSMTEDLVFAGLYGMIDPPAEGVKEALKDCNTAGIRVIMITGDHPATAKNIALRLNLMEENEKVILGKHMNKYSALTGQEKKEWLEARVFARVTPEQKLDLVKVLQEKKHIVGMTGDGVNDAPALKKSDIGIAMGKRGTQVAQQAADIVLQDDSFKSIVIAIKEGRIVFENIYRFIIYLLSSNISELFVIAAIAIFDLPFQLLPLQILFINIITDVFPALALGVTKGSDTIMQRPPRLTTKGILDTSSWMNIIIYALALGICAMGAAYFRSKVYAEQGLAFDKANNILFFTLVTSQLLHVFNMYGKGAGLFRSEVIQNKFVWLALLLSFSILVVSCLIPQVRSLLEIESVLAVDVLFVAAGAISAMVIIQTLKAVRLIK